MGTPPTVRIFKHHAFKAVATIERMIPNAGNAVWNRDACKVATAIERIPFNACDTIVERDAC